MIRSGSGSSIAFLEPDEVADLMGVDLGTVSRWADARTLTVIDGPDGHQCYALDEVLGLMVEIKRTQKSAATQLPRTLHLAGSGQDQGVMVAEAALDVTLAAEATTSEAARVSGAAETAFRDRAAVGRSAADAVAEIAAQDAIAARLRAEASAFRVREAATMAAAEELENAAPGDASAVERAARTASTVEAAAAAVASETVALAEKVARTVAMAAELVAAAQVTLTYAIEAEIAAAAAGIELRAVAAALVTAEDVAVRLDRAAARTE